MPRTNRRVLLAGLTAGLAGCALPGTSDGSGDSGSGDSGNGDGGASNDASSGVDDPPVSALHRLALTPTGAEVTGLFLGPDETLFMNVQHPSRGNQDPFDDAAVGVFTRPLAELPADFESVQLPSKSADQVLTSWGEYQVLASGGDPTTDGDALGVVYDPDGEQLTKPNSPDANVYVPTGEDEGYLFTNWETTPGMVSRMRLSRAGAGEAWTVHEKQNVDMRPVDGTWRNCFGTRSPWGTPLSAEELYYDETGSWNSPVAGPGVHQLKRYLGEYPNPYRYGYVVEFQNPTRTSPTPVKHFTLGRCSHENAVVMPDEQTVYMSDDGTGTVFFKFVADTSGDLSAGTLYAAKATQTTGEAVAEIGFDVEWLELASASNDQIEDWIAAYDDITDDDYRLGESNYITEEEIREWAAGNAPDDRVAFLESRKAAEAVGATAEFRKMEGVNCREGANPGDSLYLAMSAVTHTMADSQGDIATPRNKYGAVYSMELDADYDVDHMEPIITGGPEANVCGGCPYDAQPDSSDACANCSYNPTNEESTSRRLATENTVANPDNVVVLQDGRVVIGEDTSIHDNDMIWVYTPQ